MISETFKNLKTQNRAALTIFLSCGDPNIAFTEKLIERISKSGVDIIELGVPFSDPMADGKSIQAASVRSLKSGTTISDIVEMAGRLRTRGVKTPFVLFGYYNVFFQYGVEALAKRCKELGIEAWLIADLPLEEMEEVVPTLKKYGIDFVPLAAPTTPLERIKKISETGSGFLYYVTVTGVTGARRNLPKEFAARIAEVKSASALPVGAGFGISNFESARNAAQSADAVIVGSKFVDLVHDTLLEKGEEAALEAAQKLVEELAGAMRR